MKWFAFLCFFLICSFSTSVLGEKGNKDEAEKCPPRFHIYMENETLYLNPLRSSVSVQIINEWNEVIHEEFIPVDQPQLYMIPVDHLPSGSYNVLIVGEQMNYEFNFKL